MKRLLTSLAAVIALAVAFTGCAKKSSESDHAHAADDHHHSHNHQAPHGGTLVPLGDHQFNLEFVHDATAGKLTAYLLDAHAANFIRSPLAAIDLVVDRNGTPTPLALVAVANTATGETVGNTAEFSAEADWLKNAGPLQLTIPVLMFRNATFTNVTARLEK